MQNGETLRRITLSAPEMELININIFNDVVIPITDYTDSIRTDKSVYQKFTMDINGEKDKEVFNEFIFGIECIRFNGNFIHDTPSPLYVQGVYIYKNNLFLLNGNMIDKYFKKVSRNITVTFYQTNGQDTLYESERYDWWTFIGFEDGFFRPWESNVAGFSAHEL
ncbi:MAG: hypothetical protein NC095_11520 [Muribaculum sp.]|nr:hypothetical protein [Muribaculum sp.]